MFKKIHKKLRTRRICCNSLIIISLFLSIILMLIINTNICSPKTQILLPKFSLNTLYPNPETIPTNISHIVFSISSLVKTWNTKKQYVESWWQPNVNRGFLFLDQTPTKLLPWPSTSPPFCVSNETKNQKGVPYTIRIAQTLKETFKAQNRGMRWYAMADDDTVFFQENLVEVLRKYDHNGYYYIGMNSESIMSNSRFSFGMGFGGAGFALSYPLVDVLVKNLDVCLKRYRNFRVSDQIMQACVADLGVSLTQEKGFHQIDLHGNIIGLLSAHPQALVVSLHHLDVVEPLFPTMNRPLSLKHLMKAANTDQSRLLQQSICYNHPTNWSFSLSWGFSVLIYEKIISPSLLQVPLETFAAWGKGAQPPFMVNTRVITEDTCEIPHIFYFDSVEESGGRAGGERRQVVATYVRRVPRQLPTCMVDGNYSANFVKKIRVISPVTRLQMEGGRRECCDILQVEKENVTTIKLRPCMKYEIIG